MVELTSEVLFDFSVDVDGQPQRPGEGPLGKRQIFAITGGRFEGPKLRGVVLPGGGDWLMIRPDGVGELDVRITLVTDDEATIYMHDPGLLHCPDATRAKMRQGETVTGDDYYMRCTPRFETGDARYDWLNRLIAVGVGERLENGVGYRVFAIT